MAGIYIHIPFCKQACHYCDFHFSTSLKNKEPLINALIKEIELRKAYLENKRVPTILTNKNWDFEVPSRFELL